MTKSSILILTCLLALSFSSVYGWVWKEGTENPDNCYPDQVHLNLGDAYYNSLSAATKANPEKNTDAMAVITWQTKNECKNNYIEIESLVVDYSKTIHSDELVHDYIKESIDAKHNAIGVAGEYSSYSHTAYIKDLLPGIKYTYTIKQTDGENSAGPFEFKLPKTSSESGPVRFAIYADIDTSKTNATLNRMELLQRSGLAAFDFQLFLGDLAYDVYSENGIRGEYFYNTWQKIYASCPFMLTPGNHEWWKNYTFLNFRTKMPLYEKTKNHYFSFNVGKIHFIGINYYLYHDEPENLRKQMIDWIEADLKAANENRKERPWIIAFTHQPLYCSSNDEEDAETHRCYYFFKLNKIFDEIYQKYKVDFVLQGHVHYWERTGPTFNNQTQKYYTWTQEKKKSHIINPTAPIYTIEGSAGNNYYTAKSTELVSYSMNHDVEVGFSTITLINDTAIKYEHINSNTGATIDYFYVLKGDEYQGIPIEPPGTSNPIFWVILAIVTIVAIVVGLKMSKRFNGRVSDLRQSMVGDKTPRKETEIYEI